MQNSTYEDFGIEIPRGKTSGQVYTTCPNCSKDRKKKNDKCLGVNLSDQIWNCNHCGWKGTLKKRIWKKPPEILWENITPLRDSVVEFFQKRNIRQDTLLKMKVTDGVEWMPQTEKEEKVIHFNYFREGKLVNVKYRDGRKNFKLYKDAERIFYNLDGLKGESVAFVVEGEIDALTMIQAGLTNTVSVPNGAHKKTNNLDYLDNCYNYFEGMHTVYIATDDDEPGNVLADELARRIGIEKCIRMRFGGFKDVNEAVSNGLIVSDLVEDARPFPIEGVYTVEDSWAAVLDILENGHKPGWRPRGELGKFFEIHPGYITMATGIPGHGKSEVIDQIAVEISVDYDLRGAFFSPENSPTELHIIKLVEKLLGKNIRKCTRAELNKAKDYLNDRVLWVYPKDNFTIDNLLEKVRQAVLRYGINWFVLDPWNKIEHQYTGSETQYISQVLDKIINFSKRNGLHCFLVAHPTKMRIDPETNKHVVPGLYDISGSANFYNKADIGLTVYRDKIDDGTGEATTEPVYKNTVYVQKVKFKHWGKPGQVDLSYNKENGRFDHVGTDLTNWLLNNKIVNDAAVDHKAELFQRSALAAPDSPREPEPTPVLYEDDEVPF